MCVRSAQGVRGVRVTRHGNSEKRGRRSNCQTRGNSAGLPAALAPRASRCSLSLEARAVERQRAEERTFRTHRKVREFPEQGDGRQSCPGPGRATEDALHQQGGERGEDNTRSMRACQPRQRLACQSSRPGPCCGWSVAGVRGASEARVRRKSRRGTRLSAEVHAHGQEVRGAGCLAALAADAVLRARRGGDLARPAARPGNHLQHIGGAGAHALGAADAGVVDLHRVRHAHHAAHSRLGLGLCARGASARTWTCFPAGSQPQRLAARSQRAARLFSPWHVPEAAGARLRWRVRALRCG